MSDVDLDAQESAKEGEEVKESGDKDKFVSKDELAAITESVREQARRNEEVFKLITSPEFMNRNTPPPPPKAEEKGLTQEEIDELKPSQAIAYTLKQVGKMLDENNAKQEENLRNVAATIQRVTDVEADKDAAMQIAEVKKDFGEAEFEKHRLAMAKIVAATPGITARRAFLIAKGEAQPIKKGEVPVAPLYEKPGQNAEFTDSKLTPKEAAEKAYTRAFGANEKPI